MGENLFSNLMGYGWVAILVCCGVFLLQLFVFLPLPYLISAAILKIEGRNYWKAFGTGVLSAIATSIVGGIISALFGGVAFANLGSISDFQSFFSRLSGSIGLLMVPGIISGLVGIVISMLIAMGLYKVSFGKGALIWLVAWLFGILLAVVAGLIVFVIMLAVGTSVSDLFGSSLYYYVPAVKFLM